LAILSHYKWIAIDEKLICVHIWPTADRVNAIQVAYKVMETHMEKWKSPPSYSIARIVLRLTYLIGALSFVFGIFGVVNALNGSAYAFETRMIVGVALTIYGLISIAGSQLSMAVLDNSEINWQMLDLQRKTAARRES
jgi:hypothetical protein